MLHRGVEEGHEAGAEDEAGELAEEIREGFLGDVEGVVVVTRETIREARNAIAIAQVKRRERVGVARVDRGDQVGVGSGVVGKQTRLQLEMRDC